MQNEQLKGMLDRFISGIAIWLLGIAVSKGWLSQNDSATLLPALVVLPSIAWGYWVNRDKALLQSAATVPNPAAPDGKTLIVSDPALAADTPNQNNILSSKDVKVQTK